MSYFKKIGSLFQNKVLQKLFENFLSLTVLQGLSFITELIILPYLTVTLGVNNYGIISFATSFMLFLQIITEYGFSHSGTRTVSKYRDNPQKLQKIYSAINIVRIILSSASFVSLLIIINLFDIFREQSIVFLLLFGLIIQSVLFPIWFFRGLEKMKYITIIDLIGRIFFVIAIFFLIKSKSDYVLYAFLVFLRAIIIGIVTQLFLYKKYKIKFEKSSFHDIKFQFSNGFYMFLVYLSTSIINNLNPFFLGLLVDYSNVGIFSAGYKVIQIFILIISLITTTVFPHIVKLIKESNNIMETNIIKFIKKVLLLIIIIGVLSLGFLFISADFIVKILFGPTYEGTVAVIRILSFAPLLIGIGHTFTLQILVPLEFDSLTAKIYGSSAIVNTVLCFIFIPMFGYIGLCVIILITRIMIIIFSFIAIRRNEVKLNLIKFKTNDST